MNNLKVLIVGGNGFSAIENYYSRYLQQFGVNVSRFLAPNLFYEYYSKNFLNKIIFRLGLSSVYKLINAQFRKLVELENPDVIWIFKGLEIFPESLQWVKSKKIKLVNYNPDNPFIFSGRGSGNANITNSIFLYDLHFTYNLQVKNRLEKEFKLKTFFLPFGFDSSDELIRACEAQKEIVKVCFLGNPDKERAAFIKALGNAGIEIDVYGYYWNNYIKHSNVSIHPPVYGDELWKTLRKYRIQLNLMRAHNLDSHNMRTFEAPGVGGIMVAPKTNEHQLFFVDKKEAFFFDSVDDCVELIRYLLSLSTIEASEIRIAARKRTLDAGYSYKERAGEALIALKHLSN